MRVGGALVLGRKNIIIRGGCVIIYGLSQLVLKMLNGIFVITLPSFPDSVTSALNTIETMIVGGANIFVSLVGLDIVRACITCIDLVLLLFALWLAYDIYRWFARKIPMLGLGE